MTEFDLVLNDMKAGNIQRTVINPALVENTGEVIINNSKLKFENVPLITPNGELLLKEINFEIDEGMSMFVDGPNGCGKTSIFRLLAGLWPTYGGVMTAPGKRQMFIIPQTAYLPAGNLRD